MCRDILFDPALVNLLKEAKMFIAALDIQTKSDDPQNQADECRIPTASKNFKFLAKENHKLAHRPMSFFPSLYRVSTCLICSSNLIDKGIKPRK